MKMGKRHGQVGAVLTRLSKRHIVMGPKSTKKKKREKRRSQSQTTAM